MRILITGVTGFIGGSIAGAAAALGHEVIGTGRRRAETTGLAYRAVEIESRSALPDLVALLDSAAPDVVLHAAGSSSVAGSIASPRRDFESAVDTWSSVLEAVRLSRSRPVVIFPSSAAVYGDPARLPVAEDAPSAPISPYGYHKTMCELLGREYAACFGLDVISMRLFSVCGPRQRRLLVWEIFDQLRGPAEVVTLQGTGRETRDFLHVDDVAAAALGLAARALGEDRGGRFEAVNVASGEETSVLQVARTLRDLVAPAKNITCLGAERPGDPHRWCADVQRLSALLGGFRPRPLKEALAACAEAWKIA